MTKPLLIHYGGHSWPHTTVSREGRWTVVLGFSPGRGTESSDDEDWQDYARTYDLIARFVRSIPEPPDGPISRWDKVRRRRCLRDVSETLSRFAAIENSRAALGTCPHMGFLPPVQTVYIPASTKASNLFRNSSWLNLHLSPDLDVDECRRLHVVRSVMGA